MKRLLITATLIFIVINLFTACETETTRRSIAKKRYVVF